MNDILKKLYFDYYEGKHRPSAEYREACKRESEFLDTLDLSEETLSEMQRRETDVITESNIGWFREGFRLGVALMREIME